MSTRPGPHPPPPASLARTPLPLVRRDQPWFRHHKAEFGPIFFGRTGECRFDAPAPERAFGVLYLADDVHGAFIETFGHGHVHARGGRLVTTTALATKPLAEVRFDGGLQLVDLTDAGLVRVGADMRLCTDDYEIAQQWSGAFHDHPEAPDGLLYRSRHDPGRLCAVVYERAAPRVVSRGLGTLDAPTRAPLLADILRTYGFGLL